MTLTDEGINGHPSDLIVERTVEELRRGRAIQLLDGGRALLLSVVEALEASLLERLQRREGCHLSLLMTPQRAQAAGLLDGAIGPVAVEIPRDARLETLRALAGIAAQSPPQSAAAAPASSISSAAAEAGFRLAKLGRLVPALLVADIAQVEYPGVFRVRVEEVTDRPGSAQRHVELVSRARVPLVNALDSEIALFRQRGEPGQHLAIVVGTPSDGTEVPVRLHSACLTGDVLGSLRCDCGDQLRRSIQRIGSLGSGVLLYLDQEGRGIGLANKLRAYALQDAGLDTLDADMHLGFLADERDYAVAAAVLHELGIRRIRLLTNNPEKISTLERHGIEVAGRVPLVATLNAYNQRYLQAKLDRAGHLAE